MLIQEVSLDWRESVAQAFHDALTRHYPEFLVLESERLRKVLARGRIRSDAEFYRVRYEIDVVEAVPSRHSELENLYALVDAYETRA